jgi:hypothetical protein
VRRALVDETLSHVSRTSFIVGVSFRIHPSSPDQKGQDR